MELTKLTALELGGAIKKGQVSVKEAAQAALDQIAAQNGALNALSPSLEDRRWTGRSNCRTG